MASAYAASSAHRAHTASELHLALLRPAVLQILRAQGYYSSTSATVDALTEMTGHFISAIARQTALHASQNSPLTGEPSLVDVRMALEDCGALWPDRDLAVPLPSPPPDADPADDVRGVDEFVRWAKGPKNLRIRRVAGIQAPAIGDDGVEQERETDYLSSLKKRHNKGDQEDSKYAGTILGCSIDHGEVTVEGGKADTLQAWARMMRDASVKSPDELRRDGDEDDDGDRDSRPPSSGLSSLNDAEVGDMDMMDVAT